MRVHPHHTLRAVVTPAGAVEHRDGGEGDVTAGQLLHLLDEIHDVPAGGDHHRALNGGLQPLERGGAGQCFAGDDAVGQRRHHHLLAHHAVQVAARQVVALADEAECLRTVEPLLAGRKVGTRKRFEHRLFEAHVDAAERVGDQGKTEQPDFGVVVDGDAGEVGDRSDQGITACLGALCRRVLSGITGFDEAGPLGFPGLAVDAVDLRLAQAGRGDVGIARDRDRGSRLPVVRYPDQDDRVGVGRFLVAGAQC